MIARGSDRPLLAAGLAAFVIAGPSGELSWVRETRGSGIDWGGAYAQGVRLTGPWTTRYLGGGAATDRPPEATEISEGPGSFRVVRAGDRLRIEEEVAVHPDRPGVCVTRQFSASGAAPPEVRVDTEFAPFLAPVLMEGIRPRQFSLITRQETLWIEAGGFTAAVEADPLLTSIRVDGRPWIGGVRRGPIRSLTISQTVALRAGPASVVRLLVSGGRRGAVPFGPIPADTGSWAESSRAGLQRWESATPEIDMPAAPGLVEGYRLARRALRTLYTAPEAGFSGLVAGYPWYAALWCRDLARMLPAVLWMGDAEWAGRSLETAFAFQAPHRFPLLGAEAGEIPMQVSPGPVFLFGTSDTSLYYPELVARYLRHTGDRPGAARWFRHIEAVRGWGSAKIDAATGLFRNGGEVAEIRAATAGAGRVHLGIDATDTTIWDSADRRDHAVDLQLLWLEALRSLAYLAGVPGAPPTWGTAGGAAESFARGIAGRYTWPEESFLFDSLRADGTPVRRLRPNALQWLGAGLLAPAQERELLARAGRDDLTTDWGLRTLSAKDPEYDPLAYHMGQVWPIAGAWAAQGAFAAGDAARGVVELDRIARRIALEGGYLNECYRGDRAEPFDSCFLLGFSVAPFLAVFFEGLFGLRPDGLRGVLNLDPHLPPGWPRMGVRGVRVGPGRVDVEVRPDRVEASWTGPGPLVIAGRSASVHLDPGGTARWSPRPAPSE